MPAIGGRQGFTIQYLDFSGERKSIQLFANELTAVSLPGFLTAFGTLQGVFDAVTLGTRSATSWGEQTVVSNTRPLAKDAQIETEMLVLCQGATSQAPFSFRIPTVDYNAFNYASPPAGDSVILSGAGASAQTLALISAIEGIAKMPNDEGQAIVVVGMRVVR